MQRKQKSLFFLTFTRSNLMLRLVTNKIQVHKLQANELQTYKRTVPLPPLKIQVSNKNIKVYYVIYYVGITLLSCAGPLTACERYQPALEPRAGRGSERVYSGREAGPLTLTPPLSQPPLIASCCKIHWRTVLEPLGSRRRPPVLRGPPAKATGAATILTMGKIV